MTNVGFYSMQNYAKKTKEQNIQEKYFVIP